ncbi:hypothetical protein GQR58_027908 [Nymphon striatum]|nr:hypothetical protein GQR58_027908 [Nymphon striatum]
MPTMLLYRDLALGKIEAPENTVLITIPIYNIGGSLNRNSTTRANQNGPKAYGFRETSLKQIPKTAKAFAEVFHLVNPDIFIDNHVSNGADYQYTLTHLFTQHNKLGGDLRYLFTSRDDAPIRSFFDKYKLGYYSNYYEAIDSVIIPEAYVIKKEWTKAINLLKLNAIEHSILKRDTTIIVDANDDKLKSAFETKKTEDQAFADNWYAQLDWLFKRSEHYEPAHMQYPIYRILKKLMAK